MALTPIDFVVSTEDNILDTNDSLLDLEIETSRTWYLDFENGRLSKVIDDRDAIKQYIRKALITARSRYLIYDDFYGEQLSELMGKSITNSLIEVEVPRLIREALIYDERIADIPTISVTKFTSDGILVELEVELVDGERFLEEVDVL